MLIHNQFVLYSACWVLAVVKTDWKSDAFILASVDDEMLSDAQSRRERAPKFQEGPNGEMCLLNSGHDRSYEHTDEQGNPCRCEVCSEGKIVEQHCSCDPFQATVCVLVEQGKQMMPELNICTSAFDCKQCIYPWTVKKECGPSGPDTECECVMDGYYQVDQEDCRPVPRCNKGHEPDYGQHGVEITCQECSEGSFQPNNNSSDRCRKARECTVQEATIYSDSRCLNDPPPAELIDHPENLADNSTDGMTTGNTEEAGRDTDGDAGVSNQPPRVDNGTVVTPTESPSEEESTDDMPSCEPPWIQVCTHFIAFLCGIGVCYAKVIYKSLHAACSQGAYLLAPRRESLETGGAGRVIQMKAKKGSAKQNIRNRSNSRSQKKKKTSSTGPTSL